jgi:hypothetical protein
VSRDIFVQDIPNDAMAVDDIPDEFVPQPIGSSERVIDTLKKLAPSADFSDPSWGVIDGPGYSIEVNLPQGDNIDNFALHVRGEGADHLIAALLAELGLRAFDPHSASGIFEPPSPERSN